MCTKFVDIHHDDEIIHLDGVQSDSYDDSIDSHSLESYK
jgi:hypothetical protein